MHDTETDRTEEQPGVTVGSIVAEQDFTQKLVPAALTEKFKPLSGTSVLDAINAKGNVHLDTSMQFEQDYPCKLARGLMDVYP